MQSHEQVPVIVVCVIVGGGLVVYVLFRLLRHRKKPTPLPPIQPLAHHREQHAKQLEVERYISYSESQASRSLLGPPSSITSSPRLSPSRPGSFFGGSASNTTEDIPNLASRTPVSNEAEPLGLPNPAFLTPSTSGPSSRSSSSFEIASEGSAPSNDDTERSVTPSSPATSMSKQKRFSTTASRSSRLRPHSTLTAPSYRSTRTSRIPHARDSQIQIVLPAPLAPEIYQNKGSAGPGVARSNSQISLADKWTPSLHRSTSTSMSFHFSLCTSGFLNIHDRISLYCNRKVFIRVDTSAIAPYAVYTLY
jgi:hypothetical protein